MKTLRLKKQEERRLLAGHLWIFSNEVDSQLSPLSSFKAGELVLIQDARGNSLGTGYINPHTLLCARVLTTNIHTPIDTLFFERRIRAALKLRERNFQTPHYRLVFSEGDYLPGLIIDRFGEDFVIEMSTAGMQACQTFILEALQKIFSPRSILAHHHLTSRKLENLPLENELLAGTIPEYLAIEENGCSFMAPALIGQKTGWFYDHRNNRARLKDYVSGKRVLDLYAYLGAWSVLAAKAGADSVVAVDSSALAIEYLHKNAERNSQNQKIQTYTEDVFIQLEKFIQAGEKFDVILADPPAFIKRKADMKTGIQGYKKLQQLCFKLLAPEGILFTASCSLHLSAEELLNVIRQSSLKNSSHPRILEQLHQGQDHPLHPAISETAYLKGFVVSTGA